ncbi:hypothetical protein LTR27_011388 [Elasticomyces elasticus]|nr:hypothetical protein LTR27_011388 [Elasticomyces elasticus]
MAPACKRRRKPKSVVTADNVPNLPKSFVMAGKVLNLPELLEMIILNLPMRDMQRFRRVSKQWQATVDRSLPIKRALFLEPGTITDLANDAAITLISSSSYSRTHYSPHPYLSGMTGFSLGGPQVLMTRACRVRNAYLTQPPSDTQDFIVVLYGKGRNELRISLQAGETFGSLYDRLARELDERQWAHDLLYWYMGAD